MPARIACHNCGGRVEIPADHGRPKIRCPHCGYYAEVPAEQRSPAAEPETVAAPAATDRRAKPRIDPRDHRPDFEAGAPRGPNLLEGTTDDEDDQPYAVPGEHLIQCSACRGTLPHDATICVHCGVTFATGKKPKRKYQAVDRTWESRFPFDLRLKVFAGLQLANVLLALFISSETSPINGFLSLITQGALQAFLVGSYESCRIVRTKKGVATLTKTWRLAFYKCPPQTLDAKSSQGTGIRGMNSAGLLEWFTFIYLLMFLIVPALIFYWVVMRPSRFEVTLCDVYGSTNDVAFRTTDRDVADEICRVISDCTGLWYRPVM